MSRFGLYNIFPLEFGGGASDFEIEHQNLLRYLEPGFEGSDDNPTYWETYGEAMALAIMWACNKRLAGQGNPNSMIDDIQSWETATRTEPVKGQSDRSRRDALAAKLAGLVSNNISQIEVAAAAILSDSFVSVVVFDPDFHITYWPGVNPGPPGYEWSTSKMHIGVRYQPTGDGLERKLEALRKDLDNKLPAWMTYEIGQGDEFVVNEGKIGVTFL